MTVSYVVEVTISGGTFSGSSIAHHSGPLPGRLPVPVGDGDLLLGAVGVHPDNDQGTPPALV
jgi:hypothetical protein